MPPTNFVKDGRTITISEPADIAAAYDQGWQPETPVQHAADVGAEFQAEQFGGPVGKFAAAGTGALRTVTGGGSDVLLSALGGQHELQALREENPIASTVGEVAGAFVPVGAAGATARAGRAITGLGEGAGVLGRIGAAAAGGATEGALFGAGSGVSQLALADDPLTLERVGSVLSSNMLFGAAIGGPAGALGKAAEIGFTRAKGAIDTALEKRSLSKARTPTEAIESGDLTHVDKRILDVAERGEVARIAEEQAPQRKAFTDELDTWRKSNRDTHDIREIAKASDDPNLREASGAFDRANIRLRAALDDRVGFAEDPLRSMKVVRAQGQALEEMKAAARRYEQTWQQEVAAAPETIRQEIVNKLVPGELGPFTESGLDLAVERVLAERQGYHWNGAIRGGLKEPSIVARLPKIDGMITANQRLQAQLEVLAKPPTSDLLSKIADARAVLEGPKPAPSGLGAVASAVAPFAGPVGVAAAAGGRLLGSLRRVADAAGVRMGKAASTFLGPATKATKYVPPLATKILSAARFGEPDRKAPKGQTLPELYKARTTEIKQQIEIAADGSYQMRPDARAKMAAHFDGIRPTDPRGADRLEELGAKRIAYLASIMPRLPDYGVPQVGPERRTVPDLEMRSWARSVNALEDPHAVFERAAHGRVLPEDAAAIRAVYPELLAEWVNDVSSKLATLPKTLPRQRKLALSILTGQPIDPAMTPGVLRVIQDMYAREPGTEGGTKAPTAEAQFGSVRADPGTKAQQREGLET